MNCLKAEEQFSAYLEDELDYPALKVFESHLATCESCRHEFTLFRESVALLHQLPLIEPSTHFDAAVRTRLHVSEVEAISLWHRALNAIRIPPVWAFSGFATFVVVMLVGIYLYQSTFVRSSQVEIALKPNTPTIIRHYVLSDELGLPLSAAKGRQERLSLLNRQHSVKVPGFGEIAVREKEHPRQMERNYILQTVSYTEAPTGGGL